jgi:penicillin-binding protein 2
MFGSGKGPSPVEDRTSPMSPQLALRVTVVGGVALVLFGLIFFRLWYLQVLDSSANARAASSNTTRHIPIQSARGAILGLDGSPLVKSELVPAVSISPTELPKQLTLADISSTTTYNSGPDSGAPKYLLQQPSQDRAMYRHLASILGMSNRPQNCLVTVYYTGKVVNYSYAKGTAPRMTPIECKVAKGVAQSQFTNVTVKTGVSADIRAYIDERQSEFEGVIAGAADQQQYMLGTNGAVLFGYTGPIQADEVGHKKKYPEYAGATNIDDVGQAGLQQQYDKYLRGTNGYQAVKVDAQGEFEGYGKTHSGIAGNDLKTSIDPALEKVGQASLAKSVSENASTGGAFVAMDPQNGQVYAMGSDPTYNPKIFAHGLSQKNAKYLFSKSSNDPLLNKAIQGQGPDGSTFKVVTSTAALESHVWTPDETWTDPGYFCLGGVQPSQTNYDNGDCRHNSSGDPPGLFNLEGALEESDDDFFFHLGDLLYHPDGGALQKWEKLYGIGEPTGVDLPDESTGTLAGPALFKALYKEEIECQNATGPYKGHPKHPHGCGIADTSAWTVGDSLNTALGQGDVQVTPLQLAVIYSAVENGGTIVTPHLAEDEQTPSGKVVQRFSFPAKRHLNINPLYLNTIRKGLYYAAHGNYDGKPATSSDVMGSFGKPVYGKTGTAQYGTTQQSTAGQGSDYAWYACYVPASATHKPIAVVVWVEKGGFGDVAAAPVARQILSQWFYGHPGTYATGTSTDT